MTSPIPTQREQKMLDIAFECVMLMRDPQYKAKFDAMTRDEVAAWVARQYSECGFPNEPCGALWGRLTGLPWGR